MKKFLPVFLFIFFFLSVPIVHAQTPPCPPSGSEIVCDAEVQFIGQASSRAKDFLNWTMSNYKWVSLDDTGSNPIINFWTQIRNIMYALLIIFVLATAFILIITRGRSVTVMKFIPRFVFILIFATLSFAIVQFLYQITDVIMGFFLQGPGLRKESIDPFLKVISGDNLFFISWDYNTFIGYRFTDPRFQESAFTSILLLKLTAITFYVMAGMLLIRKVILWLFIAVSPIFPFLLLYYPIRNTGKIWIGEFFRWLLYGPLFAIFLYGLVALWQFQPAGAPLNTPGIPLNFDTVNPATNQKYAIGTDIKYPTAINIVIGGPGQTISRANNVNLPGTFALYVFALIMVWLVTFFPFVLLRIFLDHMMGGIGNNGLLGQLGKIQFGKPSPPVKPVMPVNPIAPPPPYSPQGAPTGMAKPMPMGAALRPQDMQILKTADISVPTLRDIARMETASMSSSAAGQQEISRMRSSLEKIANPASNTSASERAQFTMAREKLMQESQRGNLMAKSILSAANSVNVASMPQQKVTEVVKKVANPTVVTSPAEKEKYEELHNTVVEAGKKGSSLAQSVLSTIVTASQLEEARKKGDKVADAVLNAIAQQSTQQTKLPAINRVQAVSIDDYEQVKKMWKENYQKLEPPLGQDRNAWIKSDGQKITDTINLLSSPDPEKEKTGMQLVGNILPFLLIGGFSKTEVIAYLKAKQEAGKSVVEDTKAKEEEEESKVAATTTEKTEQKTMTMEASEDELKEPQAPNGLEDTQKNPDDTNNNQAA